MGRFIGLALLIALDEAIFLPFNNGLLGSGVPRAYSDLTSVFPGCFCLSLFPDNYKLRSVH